MQSNCSILIVTKQENETEYCCCICNKMFVSENELLIHCKIIHRPISTNFVNKTNCAFCEICELFYEEHTFSDHFPCNAVDIRCFFCLTTMPKSSHFASHNLTYHSWRKFQCNLCETDTKQMTFAELNEHMRLHNDYGCGVYQCMNCDLFMEKTALPGHVQHCHRGCRCFNEICVCDRFNETFYITKILLADIAFCLRKTSHDVNKATNMACTIPEHVDWSVEFEDEKLPDKTFKGELKDKTNPIIPTLLLEVQLESEPENFEDEINKNPNFENIYLSENYQQMISNLKSEDLRCEQEESEQIEKNTQGSSSVIEELSESEIISYLKSEQEENNHKRGKTKRLIQEYISKKPKKSKRKESECVVCGLKFEKELELHDHGVVYHRPWALEVLKDIYCVRCKSWFDSDDEYQTHQPCNEPATNRCPICCMHFPLKEHFQLHNVHFTSYKRLNCLLCEDSSEFQIHQLNKHRQTEHGKSGVFECLKCEVNFERSCDLKRHIIESCVNNKVEAIAEIYKLKSDDRNLPEHFKCETCGKLLFTKKHLREHIAAHNHGGIKLCFVCGQTFKDTSHYKDHVNTHLKTKTYECSSCDKKFLKLKHLRQHEKTHKDNKDFPCSFCSKTFAQQTSLIYHMAGHTKENVFVCSVCGEKWDTQRKLTSHMEVHNADGTNPHKCIVCQKYFTHKCNLLVHMRTHALTNKDK